MQRRIIILLTLGNNMIRIDGCYPKGVQATRSAFLQKAAELRICLTDYYQVDSNSVASIQESLYPLLNNDQYHPIIDSFVGAARKLDISFSNSPSYKLWPNDAVFAAPNWHEVLFESSHVRILKVVVKRGECVPFHTHQWESLMLVVQGAQFESKTLGGTLEFDDIAVGLYPSKGEDTPESPDIPESSINIGNTTFTALVFEVKK